MPKTIHTPTLILGAGLSGTGKTEHLKKLAAEISNSVYLDKDTTVGGMLGDKPYFTDFYWQNIHWQSYEVLWRLGMANLRNNAKKVVILDAYYGDKTEIIKQALASGVRVLVVHFHCSKEKEHARILFRNDVLRDHDKFAKDDFEAFYQKGIKSQTETLAQVPPENIIHIDTEQDGSLNQNIQQILKTLNGPRKSFIPIGQYLNSFSKEGPRWIKPAVSYFCVLMIGSWRTLVFSIFLEQILKRGQLHSNSGIRLCVSTLALVTTLAENFSPLGFAKIATCYAGGQLMLWAGPKVFKEELSEKRL